MENSQPKRYRSLSSRFALFTTVVVVWVASIALGWDLIQHTLDWREVLLMIVAAGGVGMSISNFSIRMLGRPLALLERGITSVGQGMLEPIQVSRTNDEIESLGESFNRMIRALAASHEQVRQHQELLEERIRERTTELENAMQGAMAASRTKSEFLANMSHELRTPMNGLLGMLDLVLDGPVAGEERENIQIAQNCAYTLLALLNDILDLSKIEAGRMQLEHVPCNIRSVLEDCLRPHATKARQKGVGLHYACSSGASVNVLGDPLRLRQIVNNLVSNAIKFTEFGSVQVTQSVTRRSSEQVVLTIEVADSGVGIPQDKLHLIFEKFTQADSSTTRKYGGTGLGLAITQRLVQLHGGSIRVESEEGQGSKFIVEIPYESAREPGEAPTRLRPEATPAVRGARLLLVEDNAVNQRVALAMLRRRGYSIDVANNGQEALQILEQASTPYQLILMDVQMPVLDGLETTRAIRRDGRWATIPVIAMTAHAMTGDRERCLRAGMNAYLSKPLQSADLIGAIEKQLAAEPRAVPALAAEPEPDDADSLMPEEQAVARSMLSLFVQLAPDRLGKVDAALEAEDAAKLVAEAKSIRVAARQLGNVRLVACAVQLETAATRRDFAAAGTHANQLRREFEALAAVAA